MMNMMNIVNDKWMIWIDFEESMTRCHVLFLLGRLRWFRLVTSMGSSYQQYRDATARVFTG